MLFTISTYNHLFSLDSVALQKYNFIEESSEFVISRLTLGD